MRSKKKVIQPKTKGTKAGTSKPDGLPTLGSLKDPALLQTDRRQTLKALYVHGLRILPILILVMIAWSGTLGVPFLLDDHASIANNPSIRNFSSGDWINPPSTGGETVSSRPVLNGSFALNHALSGMSLRGFHVGNLIIHLANTVLLYILVRRMARQWVHQRPSNPEAVSIGDEEKTNNASDLFAWALSGIWALHPIQTTAVTYLSQRAESLAATFFLIASCLAIVSTEWRKFKRTASLAAGLFLLLGIGTKEWVAVFPLLLLLWESRFLQLGIVGSLKSRPLLYAACIATWIPLVLGILADDFRGGSVGTANELSFASLVATQSWAIVQYLRLLIIPQGFIFDYGRDFLGGIQEAWLQILVLFALLGFTFRAFVKRHIAGFSGISFFVLLAPSSSVFPIITQTIAEHRMYLPSATVFAALMWIVWHQPYARFLKPATWVAGALLIMGVLTGLTWHRNQVYQDEITLWKQTIERRPGNARAHNNLGLALMQSDQVDAAQAAFLQALALQPNHAYAHANLGGIAMSRKDYREAITRFSTAVKLDPSLINERINIGECQIALGQPEQAIATFRQVLELTPGDAEVQSRLAGLLVDKGQIAEASSLLEIASVKNPQNPETWYQIGRCEEHSGQSKDALAAYRRTLRLAPSHFGANLAVGRILQKQGQETNALEYLRKAQASDSAATSLDFLMAMGMHHARQKQFPEAADWFQRATHLNPAFLEAWTNLGNCQLMLQRFDEAKASYERALAIDPGDRTARQNLGILSEIQQNH